MDDEIRLVKLYDAESDTEGELELVDEARLDGRVYLLLAEPEQAEDVDDPDDEDDEEYDDAAYLFRVCTEKEAEFEMTEKGRMLFITSKMSDDEYQKASELFMGLDDYELEVEGEEV